MGAAEVEVDESLLVCSADPDSTVVEGASVIDPELALPVSDALDFDVCLVDVTGSPNAFVDAGGSVVISGVGSVISVVLAPDVYAQKQFGVLVGMKSPTVLEPKLALVYVTRNSCAFSVFVFARLARGVGEPPLHSVYAEGRGMTPPACGPPSPQHTISDRLSEWLLPFQKAGFHMSWTVLMISPSQQNVWKSDSCVPFVEFAHWYLSPS